MCRRSNRKWVATQSSGVYLLNDYGNEIVRHFTSDNSPLPDQRVNAVYADVLSNSVFFATPGGCYRVRRGRYGAL